jgi:hypothetical protein
MLRNQVTISKGCLIQVCVLIVLNDDDHVQEEQTLLAVSTLTALTVTPYMTTLLANIVWQKTQLLANH